jgi:hypothetical protein
MLQDNYAQQRQRFAKNPAEIPPAGAQRCDKGHVTEHPWDSIAKKAQTAAESPSDQHCEKHEIDHVRRKNQVYSCSKAFHAVI